MLKQYLLLLTILLSSTQFAQEGNETLEAIEETFVRLLGQQAPLLAHDYYSDARELYNVLIDDYSAGYDIDELDYELDELNELLTAADTISSAALDYFDTLLQVRNDCIDKNAEELSTYYWNEAEDYFESAIDNFIDDDIEDADEYSSEAESLFTTALSYAEKSIEMTNNWAPHYKAIQAHAELLSPVTFNQALLYRNDAIEMLKEDYNEEDIEEIISTTRYLFEESEDYAIQNAINSASILEARQKAKRRNAMLLAPQYWFTAEQKFRESCLQYIDEDEDYWKTGVEAENYYNEATTMSLSAFYLNNVDNAIDQARVNKAEDFAPITFARSKDLREKTLDKIGSIGDYHDEIKSLAEEAEYEAKHASYISNLVQKLSDTENTTEEIIIASENSVAKVAYAMNVKPRFDNGYSRTTEAILAVVRGENYVYVEPTTAPISNGIYALDASELQNYTNTDDPSVDDLGETQDNSTSESQEESIENFYSDGQVEIIDEDDRIRVRLVDLVFPAASTRLENRDYPILENTAKMLKQFSDNEILIEAHTDSRASRNFNLSLSQERADAVMDYLSGKVSNDMTATGYGEGNPIEDNSTDKGRAANRRVEVIILKEGASSDDDLF